MIRETFEFVDSIERVDFGLVAIQCGQVTQSSFTTALITTRDSRHSSDILFHKRMIKYWRMLLQAIWIFNSSTDNAY